MTVWFEMFCRKSCNKAREISSSGKEALSSYILMQFFLWGKRARVISSYGEIVYQVLYCKGNENDANNLGFQL